MARRLEPPVESPFPIPALSPPLPPLPPAAALEGRGAPERTAGILFAIAAVRDGLMAFFVVVEGPLFMGWLLIPMTYTWILAVFPITGLVASAAASRMALQGRQRDWIPVVGIAALAFSTVPGILGGFGPLGLLLTACALVSHRNFVRRAAAFPGMPAA